MSCVYLSNGVGLTIINNHESMRHILIAILAVCFLNFELSSLILENVWLVVKIIQGW